VARRPKQPVPDPDEVRDRKKGINIAIWAATLMPMSVCVSLLGS
jgi:hypothetical protein